MTGRGFKDEDYDEQDCDIDNAPIRQFFDEPDTQPRRMGERYSITGRLRKMLVGDEVFIRDEDWYSEQGQKRIASLTGKSFTYMRDDKSKGWYVYRDA